MTRAGRSGGRMRIAGGAAGRRTRSGIAGAAILAAAFLVPAGAAAQDPVTIGGLLRTGFRADPASTGEADGFEIFDARARASGEISGLFDYFMQVEVDPGDETFRLLDARATVPVLPQLDLSIGLFRPSFGLEALVNRGDLTFVERDQATEAIAPGRQVGVSAESELLEGRLTLAAGVFNGNGRSLENDGNDFMVAGRAEFNSIGTIAFYDELVIQVGGSIAYSKDTSADLGRGLVTGDPTGSPELTAGFAGDRLLLGADVMASYRAWELTAEYMRGDYDVALAPGPDPEIEEADAHGGYAQLKYRAGGLAELVTRYDAFRPAIGESRRFVLFGLNILPGEHAKLGLQYAVAVSDSPDAATVAGNQFLFLAQIDF
jgi:phosphate-selective porin